MQIKGAKNKRPSTIVQLRQFQVHQQIFQEKIIKTQICT